jgi:hypothetical protein
MTTGSLPAPAKDAATAPKQTAELKGTAPADTAAASNTNWATVVAATAKR